MISLSANYIFLAALSGLLVYAAIEDVRHYVISNGLTLTIAGLFLLSFLMGYLFDQTPFHSSIGVHLLTSIGVFAFFTILFVFGQMGGGDVKLIGAVSLWAGPELIFDFILLTTLAGGVLAALQIVFGKKYHALNAQGVLDNTDFTDLQTSRKPVPYGVAIAVGGLYCVLQLVNQIN